MGKRTGTFLGLVVGSYLISCFWLTPLSFGGDSLPKPGEVIDQTNYKNYEHLFSEGFVKGFEDGFGGLVKPLSITITEAKPAPFSKVFMEASEKNRGKFSLDGEGEITGGYKYDGLPFPDLKKDDKDFVLKAMWNYNYRYQLDTESQVVMGFTKRKGESGTWFRANINWMYFANRMYDNPKPMIDTPIGVFKAMVLHYTEPVAVKDTILLTYRFLETKKSDETFIYLPTLRRCLRGEAGQRSTPVSGSIQAPDDFFLFDGRVPDFKYELVREQKVLGLADSKFNVADAKKQNSQGIDVPFFHEDWEVRDVYVIDILAKDPKYPQSRKRVYMDKENYAMYYADAYDRAGKIWKVWTAEYRKFPQQGGDVVPAGIVGVYGMDVQFGMASLGVFDPKKNGRNMAFSDYMPNNLLRMAK